LSNSQKKRRDNALKEIYDQLEKARKDNAVVLYLDEVMFTVNTVNKRAFSNEYVNIEMDMKQNRTKTTAVIAAISREHGMLYWK